jgi:Tfp pilus assembly protein PilW
MKTLLTTALIAATLILSSTTAIAKPLSKNQALSQCKALANAQFEDVKNIKIASMKTTRGQFKAKLRVRAENDKGMFLCTIERDQDAQIVRLDKPQKAVAVTQ